MGYVLGTWDGQAAMPCFCHACPCPPGRCSFVGYYYGNGLGGYTWSATSLANNKGSPRVRLSRPPSLSPLPPFSLHPLCAVFLSPFQSSIIPFACLFSNSRFSPSNVYPFSLEQATTSACLSLCEVDPRSFQPLRLVLVIYTHKNTNPYA